MGCRVGYSYRYEFLLVDVNEIESIMKRGPPPERPKRVVVLEMRTTFTIMGRDEEEEEEEGIICETGRDQEEEEEEGGIVCDTPDRETFDICGVSSNSDAREFRLASSTRLGRDEEEEEGGIICEMGTDQEEEEEEEEEEEGIVCETLDRETFDICGVSSNSDAREFRLASSTRLEDYWMSEDEIERLSEEAVGFIKEMGAQHPSLDRIPVAVNLQVCTVQQAGESYDEAMQRAMRPSKLSPLSLGTYQSVVRPKVCWEVYMMLLELPKMRVEVSALMLACPICHFPPSIGDQITTLKCGCVFHSFCVLRKLMDIHICLSCYQQLYKPILLRCRPYYHGSNY